MQFKEILSKLSFAKLLNFLGLTGGSAVHKPSESAFSTRPKSFEKARSSTSDKLNNGTRPSGSASHRSKEDDLSSRKLKMKISSKKASSDSHRYFIFTTFF